MRLRLFCLIFLISILLTGCLSSKEPTHDYSVEQESIQLLAYIADSTILSRYDSEEFSGQIKLYIPEAASVADIFDALPINNSTLVYNTSDYEEFFELVEKIGSSMFVTIKWGIGEEDEVVWYEVTDYSF